MSRHIKAALVPNDGTMSYQCLKLFFPLKCFLYVHSGPTSSNPTDILLQNNILLILSVDVLGCESVYPLSLRPLCPGSKAYVSVGPISILNFRLKL